MEVSEGLPSAATPLAIFVLVFALVNLLLSLLLFSMQWKHNSRSSLISLAAIVTAISIILSMVQQIHFIVDWKKVRDGEYETAKLSIENSSYAFVSAFNEFDVIIATIRFYCYNVQSLLFLFWAIGLWHATRKVGFNLVSPNERKIVLGAKIFAIVFPIPIVGSMRTEVVMRNGVTKLLWSNLVFILSVTFGCVFLVLILCTYVHVRRKTVKNAKFGPLGQVDVSFRVDRSQSVDSAMPKKPMQANSLRSMKNDRWLIARFLVCLALSMAQQVCVIIWYMFSFDASKKLLEQGGPDYSLNSTLDYLAITIPSVSSGLLIFFVFGTTAPFRSEYKSWFRPRKRKCQEREGPTMVAPLDSTTAPRNEGETPAQQTDVEQGGSVRASDQQRSESNTWELPPIEFEGFSEKEVLPERDR